MNRLSLLEVIESAVRLSAGYFLSLLGSAFAFFGHYGYVIGNALSLAGIRLIEGSPAIKKRPRR